MSTKLVIVESPAKAKTINTYLGKDFTVLATFGHIRDLPPKDGSVRPADGFAMDWELGERAKRPLGEIVKALKTSDSVYLATDPDREGEAIAWHLREYLREKKLAAKLPLRRVTFHEITRAAVAASPTRATSTRNWSTPISHAARSIIWSAFRSRPSSGKNCPARNPPDGCSRWRCA
jgi:DNA topoisomerase IA